MFMWDSAFIVLFARYGSRAFDFQRTLDNLYAKQHADGFICREIFEGDGSDRFERHNPSATGPNVLAWAEWEYYLNFGDKARLRRVFPALAAFHEWMRLNRTWPDGGYWSTGWGCGMDNQPRLPKGASQEWQHGGQTWADTCLQQLLSARMLGRMARELGQAAQGRHLAKEEAGLGTLVKRQLWDPGSAFFYDRSREGKRLRVKSIGAYWALLAGAVPAPGLARFVGHLDNAREFKRPHRVPSLSAEHPQYRPDGGYWLGAVWPPTNYMVLRGLSAVGQDALAHAIAMNHVDQVVQVFNNTGTVWENYAPESAAPGKPGKADFVGWSGLSATAILFEYVFGLRPDVPARRLLWDIRLLEGHGVARYPFGKAGLLELACEGRGSAAERPRIRARSNMRLTLEIRWQGGRELRQL
jgi:glycogen debranching enzyme